MAQIISIVGPDLDYAVAHEVAGEKLGKSHFVAMNFSRALREWQRENPELVVLSHLWADDYRQAAAKELVVLKGASVPTILVFDLRDGSMLSYGKAAFPNTNVIGIIPENAQASASLEEAYRAFFKVRESLAGQEMRWGDFSDTLKEIFQRGETPGNPSHEDFKQRLEKRKARRFTPRVVY